MTASTTMTGAVAGVGIAGTYEPQKFDTAWTTTMPNRLPFELLNSQVHTIRVPIAPTKPRGWRAAWVALAQAAG